MWKYADDLASGGVTKGKLKADHEVKIDIYRKPKKKRFSDFAEVELINVF